MGAKQSDMKRIVQFEKLNLFNNWRGETWGGRGRMAGNKKLLSIHCFQLIFFCSDCFCFVGKKRVELGAQLDFLSKWQTTCNQWIWMKIKKKFFENASRSAGDVKVYEMRKSQERCKWNNAATVHRSLEIRFDFSNGTLNVNWNLIVAASTLWISFDLHSMRTLFVQKGRIANILIAFDWLIDRTKA